MAATQTYSGPQWRRAMIITRLRPDEDWFEVTLGGHSAGQMGGVAAWMFRNWAVGYAEDWIERGDVELFALPADLVARLQQAPYPAKS